MGFQNNISPQSSEFPTKPSRSSRSLDYFDNCFKLLYYTLVIPFSCRFKYGDNGETLVKSSAINKVCVGFLHFYALLLHLQWLVKTIQAVSSDASFHPNNFCMMLANIVLIYGSLNFLYLAWFNKEAVLRFLEILAHVPRSNVGNSGYTFQERAELVLSLGSVILFSGLAIAANPFEMITMSFGMDLTFLGNYPIVYSVHKFLTYLVFSLVVLMINVSSILSNIGCIAVYRMGKECAEFLRNSPSLDEVSHYYERLKEAVSAMNQVIGIQVLACVLNVLTFFSKTIIEIFSSKHVEQASVSIMYIIVCIIFFLMAAIGSKNLGKIDEYLFRNRNAEGFRDNFLSVQLLKEDISFNALGLKAYEFVINFSFIVSIFSTVLTYLVVLAQFPNSTTANIFP